MPKLKLGLLLATATVAFSFSAHAYTPNKELTKRFPILQPTAPAQENLKFEPLIGTNNEMAQDYIAAKNWVEESGWSQPHSDFCFETARSTVEINVCASNQLQYVLGKITGQFQNLKRDVRSNELFRMSDSSVLAVKYLQNAAMARGKIVMDLCDTDTASWWGGTGRSAAFLGCQSKSVGDTSDFEALAALTKADPMAARLPDGSEEFDNPTQPSIVIERLRRAYIQTAQGGADFEESMLVEADQKLNETYKETQKYFRDNYSDLTNENGGWGLPDGKSLADYALGALKTQQLAWIDYRDAYCQAYSVFVFPVSKEHLKYGSVARLECLRKLTYEQVSVLKALDRR